MMTSLCGAMRAIAAAIGGENVATSERGRGLNHATRLRHACGANATGAYVSIVRQRARNGPAAGVASGCSMNVSNVTSWRGASASRRWKLRVRTPFDGGYGHQGEMKRIRSGGRDTAHAAHGGQAGLGA